MSFLLVLYVLMHYMFVSQTAQILALFDVSFGDQRKDWGSRALNGFCSALC